MSSSRVAAARARAASAKALLFVCAVLAFLAALLLAAWTRPATRAAHAGSGATSEASSETESPSFEESDDDFFGSGSIAPSQSAPQAVTGSS
jgi:hypothetical protein